MSRLPRTIARSWPFLSGMALEADLSRAVTVWVRASPSNIANPLIDFLSFLLLDLVRRRHG